MRPLKTVLFVLFMLAVQGVFSQISAVLEPGEAVIKQNETAVFLLTVSHDYAETKFFELYSADVIWDIRPDRPLRVEPKKEFVAKVFVRPLKVAPGTYGIPLTIKIAGTREHVRQDIVLDVLPMIDNGQTYLPAFKGNASMPRKIDPRSEVKIALDVMNLNRRNLSDVNIKIRSDFLNKDFVISLDPLEKKGLEFTLALDSRTEPRKDMLRISIIKSELDKTFQYDLPAIEYEVVKYGGIETSVEEQKFWFIREYGITLVNNGNTEAVDVFAFPSNIFQSLFSRYSSEGKKVSGFMTWDVRLAPGQSIKIHIVRNYRTIIGMLFFAALGWFLYYLFRSPLVLRKSFRIVRTQEDGITDLKVKLDIKNRSNNELTEVEVMDMIPPIAELVREFDVGTLAPEKIVKNEKKGTVLKWIIDVLEPNEQRVITYKITTKFSIIGGLSLPVSQARVATKAGTVKTAVSNIAGVE